MSLINAVENKISGIEKGIPFTVNYFSELANRSSIQRILSRLHSVGKIVRVMRGFYVRPKTLTYTQNAVFTTSVELLAKAWAKEKGYKLAESGMESAYRLHFQTQAPVKIIYWSDGPNKLIQIGYSTAQIKHVSNFNLQWAEEPLGRIFRAFIETPPNSITNAQLKKALSSCFQSTDDKFLGIKALLNEPKLKTWHPLLLQQFKHLN